MELAAVAFVHATFALGPPPRWLVRTLVVFVVASPLAGASLVLAAALYIAFGLFSVGFAIHVSRELAAATRGPRRVEALLLLVAIVAMVGVATPDLVGFVTGHARTLACTSAGPVCCW